MLPQLHAEIIAPRAQDGLGRLSRARPDLQGRRPGPQMRFLRNVRKCLRTVARPPPVKLVGDRVEDAPEFHGLPSVSRRLWTFCSGKFSIPQPRRSCKNLPRLNRTRSASRHPFPIPAIPPAPRHFSLAARSVAAYPEIRRKANLPA